MYLSSEEHIRDEAQAIEKYNHLCHVVPNAISLVIVSSFKKKTYKNSQQFAITYRKIKCGSTSGAHFSRVATEERVEKKNHQNMLLKIKPLFEFSYKSA